MSEHSGASEYVIGSKPSQKPSDKDTLKQDLNEILQPATKPNQKDSSENPEDLNSVSRFSEPQSRKAAKLHEVIKAADGLSLGISMVVAVLLGIGLGLLLAKLYAPLLWLGVAFGIAAAINNVYKAYRRLLDE